MLPPSLRPTLDARVRAAWQEQMAAARTTPGLAPALLQRRQDLLPRFSVCYTQLRALPRRVRRALQRQWKHSLAGVALLFALGQEPVLAATINVGGGCSLINAIRAANTNTAQGGCPAGSGADTLVLQNSSVHTLTTVNNTTFGPTGLPVVSSAITIEGRNSTIRRVSSAPKFRIFAVGSTGNLTLKETTVSGGVVTGDFPNGVGGGMWNQGTLTLTDSILSGNSASFGGGVYNSGTMTITNSTVSGNAASYGGGVLNRSPLSIHNSTLSGNTAAASGGGVFNGGGVMTFTNSTLSDNAAGLSGGGVENGEGSTLTITNSTLSGNSTSGFGGGVYNGGVYDSGTMTITNSTLSGNIALFVSGEGGEGGEGGGVLNSGTMTIRNSTLSGNSAGSDGGGVSNFRATMTITNSTLSGNSTSGFGGGVANNVESTLTLARTLVSGNTAPSSPEIFNSPGDPSFFGPGIVTANAFNLFGHDGDAGVSGFSRGPTDVVPSVPLIVILSPTLANNGGPTLTHALVPGSPALDAVATGCPPPTIDQRGLPRPQGPRCDIGAVEATFCGGRVVTLLGTPGNNTLTGTAGRDVIAGLGGNDTLIGLGGNDVLCGGEGNDILRGGAGVDWLFGGNGQDQLRGEAGNDQLRGEAGGDALDGGADTDVCDGGPPVTGDTFVNCETAVNRLLSAEELGSEGEE